MSLSHPDEWYELLDYGSPLVSVIIRDKDRHYGHTVGEHEAWFNSSPENLLMFTNVKSGRED